MGITDELREWFKDRTFMANGWQEIHDIADRIDAEHEKECSKAWMRGHDVWASVGNENVMAERGWVRLPKDADGVPWHIGDRTESGQTIEAMGLNKHGWCFIGTVNEIDPSIHRHYHAPTIEDVLHELIDKAQALSCIDDEDELVADFAKRLRLAESDGEDE